MMLRVLCGAWLVPAASLIWVGLATTGLRSISPASLALALGRTQAVAVLLAIFTTLIGASVCARQPRRPRPVEPDAGADPWLAGHAVAVVLAALAILVGVGLRSLTPFLWPVAAVAGFAAALALPRALLRIRGVWTAPLAALAVGMAFQLTIGWLHVANPAALASPILIVEGLVLAWAAASAARVEPFAPLATIAVGPTLGAALPDRTEVVEAVPAEPAPAARVSPAPARPSFAEPLAGR